MTGPALENMPNFVKDLRTNVLIPKIGHWTQQEAPDAVNGYLLDWLAGLN
jgi:pimeloyl-ACP methyl ester carboxylesterase